MATTREQAVEYARKVASGEWFSLNDHCAAVVARALLEMADENDLQRRGAVKTPGQIEYDADLVAHPRYHDGTDRRTWSQLDHVVQTHWERMAGAKAIAQRSKD